MVDVRLALLGLLVGAMALAAGSALATGDGGIVLATTPSAIDALAAQGGSVAWLDCRGASLLVAGVRHGLPEANRNSCGHAYDPPSWIALAGVRALWATDDGGNTREVSVRTASVAAPTVRRLASLTFSPGGVGDGDVFGGVASDGSALAYTSAPTFNVDEAQHAGLWSDCVGDPGPCRGWTGPGETHLVSPAGTVSTRAGGGEALALGAGLVAVPQTFDSGRCTCAYTPAWSPDARQIAFASGARSVGTSIYVVAPDGSELRRLTTRDRVLDTRPAWSPDGTQILFQRIPALYDAQHRAASIVVVDPTGGGERVVATGRDPNWSSDGKRILFVRDDPGRMYSVAASGGAPTLLLNAGKVELDSPALSPDGKHLAFVRKFQVYVGGPTGAGARLIWADKETGAAGVRWSPDGKQVVVWTPYAKSAGTAYVEGHIDVVDVPTGARRRLADGRFAAWSSDGRIVYSSDWDANLRIVDASSGAELRRIPAPVGAPASVRIVVRRVRSGAVVRRIAPLGTVEALGLASSFVAAIEYRPHETHPRLDVYALGDGHVTRSILLRGTVESGARMLLSAVGSRILFADGLALRLLDVRTGRVRTLATTRRPIGGLALGGARAVWADNDGISTDSKGREHGHGAVRALDLGSA